MSDELEGVQLEQLRTLCARYEELGELVDQLQWQDSGLCAVAYAERAWIAVLLANLWPRGEAARAAWQRQRRLDQVRALRSAGATAAPRPLGLAS